MGFSCPIFQVASKNFHLFMSDIASAKPLSPLEAHVLLAKWVSLEVESWHARDSDAPQLEASCKLEALKVSQYLNAGGWQITKEGWEVSLKRALS